jgi:hypothetical protein
MHPVLRQGPGEIARGHQRNRDQDANPLHAERRQCQDYRPVQQGGCGSANLTAST